MSVKGQLRRIAKLEKRQAAGNKLLEYLDEREAELPAVIEPYSHEDDLRFIYRTLRQWAGDGLIR